MNKYEEDDLMTCYFVIYEQGSSKIISAWSDNKEYAKAYIDFHKCKYYRIKKVSDTARNIMKIIEENLYDEIGMHNITTRDKNGQPTTMVIPMTETERNLISSEADSLLASRVNYGYINEAMYFLKDKYQKALKNILMKASIDMVVYSKPNKIINTIEIDELMVLLYTLPDKFGV